MVISKNGLKDEERTGGVQVGHHHVIPDLYAEFLYNKKFFLSDLSTKINIVPSQTTFLESPYNEQKLFLGFC